MIAVVYETLRRDLLVNWRRRATALAALLFFVIAGSLFAIAVGADPDTLKRIAPGTIWVVALFASLLSLGTLFAQDWANGSLDRFLTSPHPLSWLVLGKIGAHWIVNGAPLALVAPLIAAIYGIDGPGAIRIGCSILVGTPILSLVGAIGAALTLGVRGGGVLINLLILPICVPVLIFGIGSASAAGSAWASANLSLLFAMLCVAAWICPWASAAALRIAME
jgi:heme exporter protein B